MIYKRIKFFPVDHVNPVKIRHFRLCENVKQKVISYVDGRFTGEDA